MYSYSISDARHKSRTEMCPSYVRLSTLISIIHNCKSLKVRFFAQNDDRSALNFETDVGR